MEHMPFNDYDLAAIYNEIKDWKAAGHFATTDLTQMDKGLVDMALQNLAAGDASITYFEIHKFGKRRFFFNKIRWIIQLSTSQTLDSEITKRGCVTGNRLVSAITKAHRDVNIGFLSRCTFDMALSGISA